MLFFSESIASRVSVFLDCVNQLDEMSKYRGSLPRLLKRLIENLQENLDSQQIRNFLDVIQQFLEHSIFCSKNLFVSFIENDDILAVFLEKAFQLVKNSEDFINQLVLLIKEFLGIHFHQVDSVSFTFLQNLVSRCEKGGLPLFDLKNGYGFNLLVGMLLTEQSKSMELAEMAIKKDFFPDEILAERTSTEFVVDTGTILSKKKKQMVLKVKYKEEEHLVAEEDLDFNFWRVPRNTSVLMVAGRISCWRLVGSILDLKPEKYPTLLTANPNTIHPLFEKDSSGETIFYLAIKDKNDSEEYNICEKLVRIADRFTLTNAHIIGDETALQYLHKRVGPEPNSLIQMIEDKCKEQKHKEEYHDSPSKILSGNSCGFEFNSLDGRHWSCKSCDIIVKTDENSVISDISHYLRYFLEMCTVLSKQRISYASF